MKAGQRIWEMGPGRGTRETFPFQDHRTMAEAKASDFPDEKTKQKRRAQSRDWKARQRIKAASERIAAKLFATANFS